LQSLNNRRTSADLLSMAIRVIARSLTPSVARISLTQEESKMRELVFAVVALVGFVAVDSVGAANWTVAPPGSARSEEIKSQDILNRPNRPLHVYGDFVRWEHRRTTK
jgi:hypothetical protein